MTQDYEKLYNDALARAKSFQEKYGGDFAGLIFPELAESEDEKIRKEIISALKFANDSGVYDKHITYLEKQKEQNSADDLPKWEKVDTDRVYPCGITREYDQNGDYVYSISSGKIWDGCEFISLADLEKLPRKKNYDTGKDKRRPR